MIRVYSYDIDTSAAGRDVMNKTIYTGRILPTPSMVLYIVTHIVKVRLVSEGGNGSRLKVGVVSEGGCG